MFAAAEGTSPFVDITKLKPNGYYADPFVKGLIYCKLKATKIKTKQKMEKRFSFNSQQS